MSLHLTCAQCRKHMILAQPPAAANVRCAGCRTVLTVAVAQAAPVVSSRAVLAAGAVALLGVVGMTAAAAWVERRPELPAEATPARVEAEPVAPSELVRSHAPTAPVVTPAEAPVVEAPKPRPAPRAAAVAVVPHLPKRSEEELRQELLRVPEFRLKAAFGTAPEEAEFVGLPLRVPGQGRLSASAAEELSDAAVRLRELLHNPHASSGTPQEISDWLSQRLAKLPESATPAMAQVLCIESEGVRQAMIHRLIHVNHPAAVEALARLALFDVAENIRGQAVAALALRPAAEYRAVLLAGLRHPWPPAAEHAAWALASLEDRDAVPELEKLLDEPSPAAPFVEGDRTVVREMVRVNHLAGCLMCHPKAASFREPVAGRIPDPTQPLPPRRYYDDPKGIFVRADSTFLRQDFSLMQPVEVAHPWPAQQRFDFVVRTRPATEKERTARQPADYPQRQAVRYALQELAKPPRLPGS